MQLSCSLMTLYLGCGTLASCSTVRNVAGSFSAQLFSTAVKMFWPKNSGPIAQRLSGGGPKPGVPFFTLRHLFRNFCTSNWNGIF